MNGFLVVPLRAAGHGVVISLFGIVNTLALSVFERTREIGMLRAVGMTRRQLRRMIRYESVITAVIGGILGIAVGTRLRLDPVEGARADQGIVFAIPSASWSSRRSWRGDRRRHAGRRSCRPAGRHD